MDFTCPRPSQGKNCFQMQVREGRDRSSQDSAGSKPTGKGTEELVTFTGSRAREHQDQPCFPVGRRASALGVCYHGPSAKQNWGPGVQAPVEISAEYTEYFLSGTYLFLLETPALRQTRSRQHSGPSPCPCVPAVSRGHVFLEDGTEPAEAMMQGHAPSLEHRGTKPGTDPGGWGGLCWPLRPAEPGAEPRPGDALITKPFV